MGAESFSALLFVQKSAPMMGRRTENGIKKERLLAPFFTAYFEHSPDREQRSPRSCFWQRRVYKERAEPDQKPR